MVVSLLTADDLLTWRIRLGLIQREAAAELKTPISTYRHWEQGENGIPPAIEFACKHIESKLKRKRKVTP